MTTTCSTPADAFGRTRSEPSARRAIFSFLAVFILLGPAPGQLFGMHSIVLREWRMFSGAAVGLVRGSFTLHRGSGAVTLTPLEVSDFPSYLALPIGRRVYQPSDLKSFASHICGNSRETARLSFDGSVGTFSGWRALTAYDVCNKPAQAHYVDVRP